MQKLFCRRKAEDYEQSCSSHSSQYEQSIMTNYELSFAQKIERNIEEGQENHMKVNHQYYTPNKKQNSGFLHSFEKSYSDQKVTSKLFDRMMDSKSEIRNPKSELAFHAQSDNSQGQNVAEKIKLSKIRKIAKSLKFHDDQEQNEPDKQNIGTRGNVELHEQEFSRLSSDEQTMQRIQTKNLKNRKFGENLMHLSRHHLKIIKEDVYQQSERRQKNRPFKLRL